MAAVADKLAVIRSMRTQSPDHPDGIYHMHTCYKMSERTPHPEIGAMIAKYLGNPDADLPSFVRMGPAGNAGAGYLGPNYEPFSIDRDGRLPYFTSPYTTEAGRGTPRRPAALHGAGVRPRSQGRAVREPSAGQGEVVAAAPGQAAFDITKEWAEVPRPLRRHRASAAAASWPAS